MDMKKYLAALQTKETAQQANFGNDTDTVLGMLCSTYYELNCNADTEKVKQAFDELYTNRATKQITINIDSATFDYYQSLAESTGIPCETLISLYLTDCAANQRQLHNSPR